ncbi:uncharacterized protein [Panulirus ornatus]|uniref:uncharacterized protein isoform X12 n=1 Tax=Panulirus ornatus TaxID=150431 RepID=UPI003A84551A
MVAMVFNVLREVVSEYKRIQRNLDISKLLGPFHDVCESARDLEHKDSNIVTYNMSSDEKIMEEMGETSHDTPQAITITIMDPSALETTTLDSTLVTSVQTQDTTHGTSTILMVPREGQPSISVEQGEKDILQTVTETHMGTHELPVISNISNPEEETSEQSTIHVTTKTEVNEEGEGEVLDEGEEEDTDDPVGQHCLICNVDMPPEHTEEPVPIFKTQTTTTQRKMAVLLGSLIGMKLTSRKAHSDIMCRRCFGLLDRVDALEVEIRDTKEEIVSKYQETVAAYGGRARRRKPATAKKTDYVFPKVEPDDEDEQVLGLEMDENFEPRVEDLMEEEHDNREDCNAQDEEWEPEFKRPRIKREAADSDQNGPPKRKRGRPRKDASKPKEAASSQQPQRFLPVAPTSFGMHPHEDPQGAYPNYDHLLHKVKEEVPSTTAAADELQTMSVASSGEKQDVKNPVSSYLCKQCPACSFVFQNIVSLRNHFKKAHFDLKFLKCLQCSEEMSGDFEAYLDHRKIHLQQREGQEGSSVGRRTAKTRECRMCHKQVRTAVYTRHLATHKRIPCPECNTLIVPHSLKRHINDCHTREISYPCPDCPAVYHDASNLLSHRKRNHLGQEARRHLCEVCGKKFITPSDLRTHVTGVHHNVKKFVCEFCGLSFKISSALMYHRRLHTGERPHVCQLCGRTFMKPNGLAKHVRRVHRVEYHGKYRKRLHTPEPSSRNSLGQTRHGAVLPKREGILATVQVPQILEDQTNLTEDISPAGTEAPPQVSEGGEMSMTAVYSLGESTVVQMTAPVVVSVPGSQPIHSVTYFRSGIEDHSLTRSYEATQPLHTIAYFRPSSDEQYTVAELLPPQETRLDPADSVPSTYITSTQSRNHTQHH